MTWSDAARRASAEARRRKARSQPARTTHATARARAAATKQPLGHDQPQGTYAAQRARNLGGNAKRAAAHARKYHPNSTASANARAKLNNAMARWQ